MRAAVRLEGRGLAPETVAAVARGRVGGPVSITPAGRERNAAARGAVEAHLAAGAPLYGATTGVGPFVRRAVTGADHQLRLLRSHASGGGAALAPELVRAAMVVRANQLAAGGAGVGDELLDALVAALNAGVTPVAHELGALGTGDITVLAEIAVALLGEGEATYRGRRLPASAALSAAGLAPPELGARDGIAFMSSNAAVVGHAALAAVDARRALDGALTVAALSFAAVDADRDVLDARVHAARALPGQVSVAERVRTALGDTAPTHPPPAAPHPHERAGRAVHDPFAFRVQPQVDGAAHDALDALERVLAVELNAAAENALAVPGDDVALSSGNFHLAGLALALDGLRAALAQSASLVAARCSALLDAAVTGLAPALAGRASDSGAMILEYPAHAAAADARWLAAPMTAQTAVVGAGLEAHASFAAHAARRTEEAVGRHLDAVAVELVLATRALRLRGRPPAAEVAAAAFAVAAEQLPAGMTDRPLSADVAAARALLAAAGLPVAGRQASAPTRVRASTSLRSA
jgi:histidine ammonia-lyase